MKNADLRKLAEAKIRDALLLFENSGFSNAYYLAGYSLEIAMKACIAKQFSANTMPDKQMVIDTYSHDLNRLIGVAGLRIEFLEKREADTLFAQYWAIASKWSPESRYRLIDKSETQYFLNSIVD